MQPTTWAWKGMKAGSTLHGPRWPWSGAISMPSAAWCQGAHYAHGKQWRSRTARPPGPRAEEQAVAGGGYHHPGHTAGDQLADHPEQEQAVVDAADAQAAELPMNGSPSAAKQARPSDHRRSHGEQHVGVGRLDD